LIRTIALTVLVALSLAITAPAFAPAPAYAADGATTVDGLPSIPWTKVAQWVIKNALTLLMLAEEIWRDMQGAGSNPPPEQQPPPTPCVAPDPGLELAWALPGAARGFA
jgi:hypothetical protein